MINLTSTKKDEKVYVCEVTGDPQTAGKYQDTLTFEIGHESPSYTINYEANGGFKDDRKIRAVSFPLKKRHLRRARPLVICRLPSSPVIHFSAGAMTRAHQICRNNRPPAGRYDIICGLYRRSGVQSHAIAAFARAIDVDGASLCHSGNRPERRYERG